MKTFSRCLSKVVLRVAPLLAALTVAGLVLTTSSSASACRDCPFPLKVSDHQWLMPESKVVVTIEERQVSKTMLLMTVVLRNRDSGTVLAHGTAMHGRNQRQVNVTMHDNEGHKVTGLITWVDYKNDVIQAAFDCDENDDDACSIGRNL